MGSETPPTLPELSPWMRGALLIATIYHLAWGLFIYHFSNAFYHWITTSNTAAPDMIRYYGTGMLVMAALFFMSALYLKKFWYFIIIGVLSKIIGSVWLYFDIMGQQVTKKFLFHLTMNDMAWVIPLGIIAYRASQIKK